MKEREMKDRRRNEKVTIPIKNCDNFDNLITRFCSL